MDARAHRESLRSCTGGKGGGMHCQSHHGLVFGSGEWQPHTFFFFFSSSHKRHMLLKAWFYSTAWALSCCSFDPTKARVWFSCARGHEGRFYSHRHVSVYVRLSRWGRVCRERHCWMPQSQILSGGEVSNLIGASSSWKCPWLPGDGMVWSKAVWEKLNQQEQNCSPWDNWGNGSSVHTSYLGIPVWERREFTVVAFTSWCMI